jgi:hypothetical protein
LDKLHVVARELTVRIIIEHPPHGVDYVLQKARGSDYEMVQTQRSDGEDLAFEFQPSIKDGVFSGVTALGGPFIQGAAG